MKKHDNGVIEFSAKDLIDNYRKAYDKAKEAAVAAKQVSMPPLLEMEKMWLDKHAERLAKANKNEKN